MHEHDGMARHRRRFHLTSNFTVMPLSHGDEGTFTTGRLLASSHSNGRPPRGVRSTQYNRDRRNAPTPEMPFLARGCFISENSAQRSKEAGRLDHPTHRTWTPRHDRSFNHGDTLCHKGTSTGQAGGEPGAVEGGDHIPYST